MRSIRELLLAGAGAVRVQETAARGVEGVRVSGDGVRQGTETACSGTGQVGEFEGASGPGGSESSGSHDTGGDCPGEEEGTGVARRQFGGLGAGVAGGKEGDPGSGARKRVVRDRGKAPHAPSRWSIISMNVDGGALDELGRSLAAAACKGGAHGGVVLLQDVRLEGRFVAATIKESAAVPRPRTTGLKG